MEPRKIPGYYYDAEKKKYFKILPNHVAPTGARYSRENVRKAEEETRKRKRSECLSKRKKLQTVQRSKLLNSSLTAGVDLSEELDQGHDRAATRIERRAAAYAGGLHRRVCFQMLPDRRMGSFGYSVSENDWEINHFDYDRKTTAVLLALSSRSTHLLASIVPNDQHQYNREALDPIWSFTSKIASININPLSRTLIATSMGSHQPPKIHLTSLLDTPGGPYGRRLDTDISTELRMSELATIWTSALNSMAGQYDTPDMTAIGTSSGVINLVKAAGNNWHYSFVLKTESDVLALDWLGPTTLAAGLRDSKVYLWDSRSQGSVLRLCHNGAVAGLRRIDDSRIAVCGFPHALAMYDLRMVRDPRAPSSPIGKAQPGPQERKKRKKQRLPWHSQIVSEPVLRFEYENAFRYPLGFDVAPDLGLMAAADQTGSIQMYSLRSGEKIKWAGSEQKAVQDSFGHVKCLRFIEDARESPKVMATRGAQLVEYTW